MMQVVNFNKDHRNIVIVCVYFTLSCPTWPPHARAGMQLLPHIHTFLIHRPGVRIFPLLIPDGLPWPAPVASAGEELRPAQPGVSAPPCQPRFSHAPPPPPAGSGGPCTPGDWTSQLYHPEKAPLQTNTHTHKKQKNRSLSCPSLTKDWTRALGLVPGRHKKAAQCSFPVRKGSSGWVKSRGQFPPVTSSACVCVSCVAAQCTGVLCVLLCGKKYMTLTLT